MSPRRAFALGVAVVLVVFQIAGAWAVLATGVTGRLVPADREQFDALGLAAPLGTPADTAFIESVLPDTVRAVESVLRWTLNQAPAVGDPGPVASAREAYGIAADGGGLLCSQLALLFRAALRARGHSAREVRLARSFLSESDTHVTVEVRVDGRWAVYDPTFHATFERDGRAVSAAAIHQALLEGTTDFIEPVFHGPVAYPARLESYYTDWRPLFNNVLVIDPGRDGLLATLPPFRYWLGPRWYYLTIRDDPALWHAAVGRWLYAVVVAFLPIALLTVGLGLGVSFLRRDGGDPT